MIPDVIEVDEFKTGRRREGLYFGLIAFGQNYKNSGSHLNAIQTMFAFGTPDEVYNYCKKLIREIGPDGFILQSECDIPTNAKLENVQAMVSAARDS